MKQLDTHTVLEIIKMLDARIRYYDEYHSLDDDEFGAMWALENFRDHLQSYIEGLVSQAENNLNAGE